MYTHDALERIRLQLRIENAGIGNGATFSGLQRRMYRQAGRIVQTFLLVHRKEAAANCISPPVHVDLGLSASSWMSHFCILCLLEHVIWFSWLKE